MERAVTFVTNNLSIATISIPVVLLGQTPSPVIQVMISQIFQ